MSIYVEEQVKQNPASTEAEFDSVGIGVVGAGYWGPHILRNALQSRSTRLTAVCDFDLARASRLAGSISGVTATGDLSQILEDPAVEAIAVVTPPATHLEAAMAVIEAGRHVLVEKPLASSYAEARALVNAADARGVVLMCDQTYCYTPAVERIRDLVRSGVLGELHFADSIRINLGLVQHDVDVLWDLAPHDLSILDFIFPDGCTPLAVSAHGADPIGAGQACVAYLTLELPRGAVAHLHVNWLSPVKVRTTTIAGLKRTLVWDDLNPSQRISVYAGGLDLADPDELDGDDRRQTLVSYRSGDMVAPPLPERESLQGVMAEFADCIRTGRSSVTEGTAGLRVLDILKATSRSLEFHGSVVPLHRER